MFSSVGKALTSTGSHFRTTLLAGILVVIPVVVTFLILRFVFDFFDPLLKDLLDKFLPSYSFPGMGIVGLVIIIYLVGLVTTHVLGRRAIQIVQGGVNLIPVVRSVYRTARQATDFFSAVGGNGRYTGVVLVEFPSHGLRSIGLVTGRMQDQDGTNLLAVYMPTSPFPTSGFLVIVPETQVVPTDMAVDDAMKLIISAGIASPDRIVATPNPFKKSDGSVPRIVFPSETQASPTHGSDSGASNQ